MLTIKMTTGQLAGKSRLVSHKLIDPVKFLSEAVSHGWHWEVDYSGATPEEVFYFFRADIACRAMLARKEGRPVFFEGREFSDLQEWEDAIVSSRSIITIEQDNEKEFRVKAVGPEN